jgi:hypothetical protein
LLTRPTVTIDPVWSTAGWAVDSTSGSIAATAVLTRRSDGATGVGYADPWSFDYSGTLTFDASGAVFSPLVAGVAQPQSGA